MDATVLQEQAFCAICQCRSEPGEALVACPGCGAEYHDDCWRENGGCALHGCAHTPATEKRDELDVPVSWWGQEHKPCPVCGAEIRATALRCRQCGSVFASARPQTSAEHSAHAARTVRQPVLRQRVIWLFALGVLPFTAPLAALAGGAWLWRRRRDIAALPTLYVALARLGVGIAAAQTLLMLLAIFVLAASRS